MGLRLAVGGDRSARVRLLLMVLGVAAAVALLLAVAGAGPAAVDRLERVSSRSLSFDDAGAPPRAEGVRARMSVGFWRGQPLRVLDVEVVGPAVPGPPGVARVPAPGEVLVSPALSEALAGPRADELSPRLRGTVVGTIDRSGLVGPDELFAVAGRELLGGEALSAGFGTGEVEGFRIEQRSDGTTTSTEITAGISDELRTAMLVAAIGLIVPLLVLVATATRLSAASRERRAAALRLVGVTARQLGLLGGIEGAIVGIAGAATGLALFQAMRAPVAGLVPVPGGLFAQDVAPPAWAVVLIILGVPGLTAAAGLLAVRRAATSPLDVRRQATAPVPSFGRLLPLTLGVVMLFLARANAEAVTSGRWYGVLLLVGGAGLCLIGIAVAGAALARVAGALLTRFGPGPASQLAGRRLLMDPSAAARTVTGTALVVVVVGWLLAFLPLLAATTPSGRGDLAADLRPATVVASFERDAEPDAALAEAAAVSGAGPVLPVSFFQLLRPGAVSPGEFDIGQDTDQSQFPVEAMVVSCTDLSQVLAEPLTGCGSSGVYRVGNSESFFGTEPPGAGTYDVLNAEGLRTGEQVQVLEDVPVLTLPDGLLSGVDGFGMYGQFLFTTRPVASLRTDAALIGTDGQSGTVEAVRAALGAVRTPFAPLTADEATAVARSATDGYARAGLIGLVFVVLVGGLSLAVTTADGMRERRQAHAALAAMGTPARLLRRSVLLQTLSPLVLTIGLALAVSATAAWLYLRIGASDGMQPIALPWVQYAAVAATAVLAGALATAAVLPFVNAAVRPDALRTE